MNNVMSIVKDYYDVDYQPVFSTCFDFFYKIDNRFQPPLYIDNVSIRGCHEYEHSLRNLCGFEFIVDRKTTMVEFINKIKEELYHNNPIALCIDSYYLPWNQYYNKRSLEHIILVCGMDEDKNLLYFCDGFLSNEIQTMSFDDCFRYLEYLIILKRVEMAALKSHGYISEFLFDFQNNNPEKYDDLYRFSADISHFKVTKDDGLLLSDPMLSNFLYCLTCICWDRINFIQGLKYLEKVNQREIFSSIYSGLETINNNWLIIKSLTAKSLITGKSSFLIKAADLIKIIADKEKAVTPEIIKHCEDI